MVARADEALHHRVARHGGRKLFESFGFRRRSRKVQGAVEADRFRNRLIDQRIHRRNADPRKHCAHIVVAGADVAICESVRCRGHLQLSCQPIWAL
jgi:hypothetical protein